MLHIDMAAIQLEDQTKKVLDYYFVTQKMIH